MVQDSVESLYNSPNDIYNTIFNDPTCYLSRLPKDVQNICLGMAVNNEKTVAVSQLLLNANILTPQIIHREVTNERMHNALSQLKTNYHLEAVEQEPVSETQKKESNDFKRRGLRKIIGTNFFIRKFLGDYEISNLEKTFKYKNVTDLQLSPDKMKLCILFDEGPLKIYGFPSFDLLLELQIPSRVNPTRYYSTPQLFFDDNGTVLCIKYLNDNRFIVWDISSYFALKKALDCYSRDTYSFFGLLMIVNTLCQTKLLPTQIVQLAKPFDDHITAFDSSNQNRQIIQTALIELNGKKKINK
jgi:hypothetical protein